MKLKELLCLCLFWCAMVAYGSPVDPTVAHQVACNFWSVNAGKTTPVNLVNVTDQFGFQEFYIFVHPQGKGFVLVSADDCVQPVIGYSLNSRFVFPLPAHVQAHLQGYEQEIAYYKAEGFRATGDITELWQSMRSGSYSPRNIMSVSPLLTTTWDQRPYYNELCPDSAGIHAVTGCSATATAQVMKFWNWPNTGTGSHTYTDDNFGTLTANFGATTYQWSLMPNALSNSSTADQINAVATLMFHVGVAIETDYGINASSAYTNSYGYSIACSENALKDYFGYKSTLHSVYKEDVSDATWISTLTAELDARRPVIERGSGSGGHAFVCDGYDNNGLFHINWGWSGSYDGYFAHNALNPGGGGTGSSSTHSYNDYQALVVGIEPIGLHTNTQYLTLPQEGGTASFTVISNEASYASWTASSNQSWLTVSPSTGAGSGQATNVNVTATANTTGAYRQAAVTITQGSQSVTVIVGQCECPTGDMCSITLEMEDSYGDGWNGFYLTLSSSSGFVYGTATFSEGSIANQQFNVCPSDLVITGTSGQYDYECSFTVYNASNQALLTASYPFDNSYTITTPCAGGTQPPTTCEVTTFPWIESFEGDLSCWTTIDADGDGNTWGRTTSLPYNGTYALYSRSYDSESGAAYDAENYLISPQITLPATGTYQLDFYARSANGTYPDSLWVKLSTTTNSSTSAFNTILMQKTKIPADLSYEHYTINLSGYNGQSFYLAFVHDTYNGYHLFLDNISIVNASQTFTITATSVNSTMGTVTGGGTYASGAEVTLEATANAGYRFTGWDDNVTDNPRNLTVTANASYTAYFADLGTNELHYDNGTYKSSMGAGGTFYWAVRFPASVLTSYTTLNSVQIMDMNAGSYQVSVCQGGTDAPGTQVASQTFSLNGTQDWFNAAFSSPVTINPSQALWIVLYNTDVNFPAAVSTYAGNPDGSWMSMNGTTWNSICDYGYHYTWMVRPVLSSGSTPQTYTITAVSANTSMGEVIGGGTYAAGTTVQLMANAYSGYEFVNWQDGNISNPRYITVTGNASYTAYFQAVAPSNYTITATSANSTMGTVTGGGTYASGAEVTLEATANAGYRFTGWNDGNTENPRVFTATGNASYTAYFADLGTGELHYDNGTFETSIGGTGGSIYWAVRFPASVLSSYNTLTSVRIMDMYSGSYQVRICQGGTSAPGTEVASQTFNLNGTEDWFTATFSTPVTINPAQPLWVVLYYTGTYYPAAGSTYAGNPDGSWVSLDGTTWNSICDFDYYLSWMLRPVLSTASAPQTYTITAVSANNSMGEVIGGGTYSAGTTVQLMANAAAHHHFVSWNDGNTSNPRYITVTGNATYVASFALDQYQINVISGNDAMGSVIGGGPYDYGTTIQIRADANPGYEFTYWNDGNTDNPRFITVVANATYVANFQPQTGINDNDLSLINVYSYSNQIIVSHAEGESIEIYDMLGKRIAYDAMNSQETRQFTIPTKGIYLVRVGDSYFKKVIIK